MPAGDTTLLVAQGAALGCDGTWTLVTAPTPLSLYGGMRSLTGQANWSRLAGRIDHADGDG